MQKAPARQLVNLKNIPVMVMAAEASYHQIYDHCTAKYLNQAGVKTEYIRLQDKGICGNGHMVMIEKNNLDIARLLDEWVQKNVGLSDLRCRSSGGAGCVERARRRSSNRNDRRSAPFAR